MKGERLKLYYQDPLEARATSEEPSGIGLLCVACEVFGWRVWSWGLWNGVIRVWVVRRRCRDLGFRIKRLEGDGMVVIRRFPEIMLSSFHVAYLSTVVYLFSIVVSKTTHTGVPW